MSTTVESKEQMWMYIDQPGATPKGPVPSRVLCRLLEKGLAGLSEKTLVWQTGMTNWQPVTNQPPFDKIVEFHRMQWYYIVSETNEQKGPVSSRLLMHRLQQGEIDGMTLVYGGDGSSGWQRISENIQLKAEVQKMAAEETARDEAFAAATEEQMVFVGNEEQPKLLPAAGATKKTFTADDGKRYLWDEHEEQWVETDEQEEYENEENDLDATENLGQKRYRHDAGAEGDSEDDEPVAEAPQKEGEDVTAAENEAVIEKQKRKRSKKKSKKGPNTWIYVSGLPPDVTLEEIKDHFSKVGLIAISPYDQQPRIKIYRDPTDAEKCKGDCTICYNAIDSMRLAVEILHEGYIRPNYKISVTPADFSSSSGGGGGSNQQQRNPLSQAQIKVAKSAMRQALAWNEDDDIGVNRAAALRIVVLEGLFQPHDFNDPNFEVEIENDLGSECTSKCGPVEKITIFSRNPRGIAIIKFATAFAAQECTRIMNGRFFGGQKIKCYFWDGVTNYSIVKPKSAEDDEQEEKEENDRLDEFGDWLEKEQEDLPEEFQIRSE